jgi:membrane associated rhomboid family serine protease
VIENQDYDFLRTFWTRRAVISYSVFALNIIIFVLMTLAGGSDNPETLLHFGAKSNFHINNGEIWRFVTPIFLHIGFIHLFFNSYALWIIGPQVEKLYGGPRFLLLYLLTGMSGAAASYWYNPFIPSAGASGSIFGLLGVLLVFSIKYRREVPQFFSRALGRGILLTIGINLVIGYMIPQIDNAAHLGGLIGGGVLAAVIPFAKPGERERPVFKVAQAAAVLVIAVSFFEVLSNYQGPTMSLTNLTRSVNLTQQMWQPGRNRSTLPYIDSMNYALQVFDRSEAVLATGDFQSLPDVQRELGTAIDKMKDIPSVDSGADEFSAELLKLVQKQYEYVTEVQRTGRARSDFIGASPQSSSYGSFKKRLENWVDTEGGKYFQRPR